jgi:hypothetical protein
MDVTLEFWGLDSYTEVVLPLRDDCSPGDGDATCEPEAVARDTPGVDVTSLAILFQLVILPLLFERPIEIVSWASEALAR